MKGGTANIKNRNIFTLRVEVHNLGFGSVDNKMFIPGVHSQPTQHDLHITGLISQQSQIICIQHVWDVHTRGSGDSPWYLLSNVVNIVDVKGKKQGWQGAALLSCYTPRVGCKRAVLSPSFRTYSSRLYMSSITDSKGAGLRVRLRCFNSASLGMVS